MKNQEVQNDFKRVKKRIEAGTKPTEIGRKSTSLPGCRNIVLIKVGDARCVVKYVEGGQVDILGVGARGNKANMKALSKVMKKVYDIDIYY